MIIGLTFLAAELYGGGFPQRLGIGRTVTAGIRPKPWPLQMAGHEPDRVPPSAGHLCAGPVRQCRLPHQGGPCGQRIALADLMYVAKDLAGQYYETGEALLMLGTAYLAILPPMSAGGMMTLPSSACGGSPACRFRLSFGAGRLCGPAPVRRSQRCDAPQWLTPDFGEGPAAGRSGVPDPIGSAMEPVHTILLFAEQGIILGPV